MSLNDIYFFDYDPGFFGNNFQYLACLCLYLYLQELLTSSPFFNLLKLMFFPLRNRFYKTSGAREIIFINCFALNSRATGQKILVQLVPSDWKSKQPSLSSKLQIRSVRPFHLFYRTHYDSLHYVAFFNFKNWELLPLQQQQ